MSELSLAPDDDQKKKSKDEPEVSGNATIEMLVVLLHIVMCVFGFLIAVVGAAYAYYFKIAFVLIGLLMLVGGGLGAAATYKRDWFFLFVVNCTNASICLLVFIYCVVAGMVAFDIRDPIFDSVDTSWDTVRPVRGIKISSSPPEGLYTHTKLSVG